MISTRIRSAIFDAILFSFLAGVAWYYILRPSDIQLNDLATNATVFGGFFIVGTVLSLVLNTSGLRTLGEVLFEPAYKKARLEEKAWYRSFHLWQLWISLITAVIVGCLATQFSLTEITDEDGFNGAMRLFAQLLNPNFSILPQAVLHIVETLFMAFIATIFAIPIAFVLSFLCAKNIMKHPAAYALYMFLRTLLNVTRSVEAFMWAIIFSVWVGIGPFAGMLALMIHSVASLAKQYSEMVETVSEGPIEGIQSTGANKLQTIWFAIVPQVILPYISFTVYRWDINIRMATIVGFVGGGGIGKMLILYQQQALWNEVGCIFLVIAIVVWAMDQASAYIREALK